MVMNISKLSVPHFIEKNELSRNFLGYVSLGKFLNHVMFEEKHCNVVMFEEQHCNEALCASVSSSEKQGD